MERNIDQPLVAAGNHRTVEVEHDRDPAGCGGIRLSTTKPTQTQIEQFDIVNAESKPVLARLKALVDIDLPKFEKQLQDAGAPLIVTRVQQGPGGGNADDVDDDGRDIDGLAMGRQ